MISSSNSKISTNEIHNTDLLSQRVIPACSWPKTLTHSHKHRTLLRGKIPLWPRCHSGFWAQETTTNCHTTKLTNPCDHNRQDAVQEAQTQQVLHQNCHLNCQKRRLTPIAVGIPRSGFHRDQIQNGKRKRRKNKQTGRKKLENKTKTSQSTKAPLNLLYRLS